MEKRLLRVTMQREGLGSVRPAVVRLSPQSECTLTPEWRDQGQLWGPGNARAARVRNTCHVNDFLVGYPAFSQSAVFSILQFWMCNSRLRKAALKASCPLSGRMEVEWPLHGTKAGSTALQLIKAADWEWCSCGLSEQGWRATLPFSVSSQSLSCRSSDA